MNLGRLIPVLGLLAAACQFSVEASTSPRTAANSPARPAPPTLPGQGVVTPPPPPAPPPPPPPAAGTPAPAATAAKVAPPAPPPPATPAAPPPPAPAVPALPAASTSLCLDAASVPAVSCASGPACPGVPGGVAQACTGYASYFTPKVAAAASYCAGLVGARGGCTADQLVGCAQTALRQACPDSSIVQLCQVAAAPCKVSASDCSALTAGLNDKGRQAVAQCVANGCGQGLNACISSMLTH